MHGQTLQPTAFPRGLTPPASPRFPSGPDAAVTGMLLCCIWTAVLILFAVRGLRRSGALGRAAAAFRRLPAPARAAAVLAAAGILLYGGTKPGFNPLESLIEGVSQLFSSQGEPLDAPAEPSLSESQWLAGFALSAASTNEVFDLSAPSGAVVHDPWLKRGASEDGFWCSPPGWSFPLGTNRFSVAYVSSSGTLSFGRRKGSPAPAALPDGSGIDFLAPLHTLLGVAPEANWDLLSSTNSLFWHDTTETGSARFTWQNVLLGRDADAPVSFQAELHPSGDFVYRYDISALPSGAWPPTNAPSTGPSAGFAVGAQQGGGGETALIAAGTQACTPSNHVCAAIWRLSGTVPAAIPLCEALAGAPRFALRWTSLDGLDPAVDDPDGDGLSNAAEVLLHHTDPRLADTDRDGVPDGEEVAAGTDPLLRDTDGDGLVDGSDPDPLTPTSLEDLDGDGIPDAYEIWRFGSTNAVDSLAIDITANGFPLSTEIAAGMNPFTEPSPAVLPFGNLASLRLFDSFQCDFDADTNLVYRQTFSIDRDDGWRQYFLSASPDGPGGWSLEGMVLEWEDSGGASGTVAASPPGDSLRLPLSPGGPATLTLSLRATSASVLCLQSLHLLAWAPEIEVSGAVQATVDGSIRHAVARESEGTGVRLDFDLSNRPCKAVPSESELAARSDPFPDEDRLVFVPDAPGPGGTGVAGGTLAAKSPGAYGMPQRIAADSVGSGTSGGMDTMILLQAGDPEGLDGVEGGEGGDWILFVDPRLTYGHGHSGGCATPLLFDLADGTYAASDAYPLDSDCLRRNWVRDATGGYDCNCEPEITYGDESLKPFFEEEVTVDGSHATGILKLAGQLVWQGEAWHHLEDGCADPDGCYICPSGCADGNCDYLEGDSAGSLAFRIPLGMPRASQVSGFLWFRTEGPLSIAPAAFNLLARPDSAIADATAGGTRTVACSDFRGRTAVVDSIANGVRITLTQTAGGALEHTWEITNVGGSPSEIRLRKVSRLNNTMSDRTYEYRSDGAPSPSWTRLDNIAAASEQVITHDGLNNPADGIISEERIVRDTAGTVLSHTVTESRRFGFGAGAVLREIRQTRLTADGWTEETTSYWTDPANPRRNGKPRLRSGNAGAWSYRTWDAEGRELLRLEPFDGSDFPAAHGQDPAPALTLGNLPASVTALATLSDYTPLPDDGNHRDNLDSVRTSSRYLVSDGVPTLVGRSWRFYLHGTNTAGHAFVTLRTVRAGSQTAAQAGMLGDPGNAVTETTAYDADAPGIPLLLRGQPIVSTGADGVATSYAYALGTYNPATRAFTAGGAATHLRTTVTTSTAAAPGGIPGKSTVSVTVRDAVHGTEVYSANLAILADAALSQPFEWRARTYDDKNRLRATLYSDGSSSTNAYSCCRLLWSAGRDGARVLRSATTGTDHLYYAEEEVSLADLPVHGKYVPYLPYQGGYRVVQHFMDALGRETNTVVRPARVEGVATNANFVFNQGWRTSEITAYPDGTSDHSVRTDARGVRTVSRRTSFAGREVSVDQTFHPTNVVVPVLVSTNTAYRNGRSVSERYWDGQWTRVTRWTEYDAGGCRRTFSTSEASDRTGAVTNSVTASDFLGRAVATATPLGVTSNTYSGASARVLMISRTGQPATEYLYDVLGNRVGTVAAGITNRTEVTYEAVSNVLWRVTESCAGEARSVTRERLTGLSDNLRRHTLATGADNVTTEVTASYHAATRVLTETSVSSVRSAVTRKSKYGRTISESSADGQRYLFFDPYGRVFYTERELPGTTARLSDTWTGFNDDGTVYEDSTFIGSGTTYKATFHAYDAFGRTVASTNALGEVVHSAYDAQGRSLSAWGATYPTAHEYDTAGNRTSLYTYRGSGEVSSQSQIENLKSQMDRTQWHYDSRTGLATNKVYADASSIAYAHTPDGKPTRTTWARGAWREHAYDASGLLAGIEYGQAPVPGPATPAVSFAYDAFRRLASATNAVAAYAYTYSDLGVATNETVAVSANLLVRLQDAFARPVGLSVVGLGEAGPVSNAVYYGYDTDNRLATVSNAAFSATYAFTSDGWDAGYTVTLTNGTILSRAVTRDPYRRHLVMAISNTVSGAVTSDYRYDHDLLDRATRRIDGGTVTNAFGYNPRSEVISATISNTVAAYVYDGIGNRLAATNNAVATFYASSPLNQYLAIHSLGEGGTNTLAYDPDGNLLTNGVWAYTWDAENRLVAAYSNATLVVSNAYDHASRRVLKVTPSATHTYLYDGWNLVQELNTVDGSLFTTNSYFWGRDLSGSFQGAGGVGGLLAVMVDSAWYFPLADANGNITEYVDAAGTVVAFYRYDAYGGLISSSGVLCGTFKHRFSSKYIDSETGLYYYGYRFYSPELGRWLNRDPIEEAGGLNLYGFCGNGSISSVDGLGLRAEINVDTMDDAKIASLHEVKSLFEMTSMPVVQTKAFYIAIRDSLRVTRKNHSESLFYILEGTRITQVHGDPPRFSDDELLKLWRDKYDEVMRSNSFSPQFKEAEARRRADLAVSGRLNVQVQTSVPFVSRAVGHYHSHPPSLSATAAPSIADHVSLTRFRQWNDREGYRPLHNYFGFVSQPVLTDYESLGTKRAAEIVGYGEGQSSAWQTGIFIVCW